jgi:hypothetical protein
MTRVDDLTTHRWVAGATSAADAARALARSRLRSRRTRINLSVLWLASGGGTYLTWDEIEGTGTRVAWAYGVVTLIWLVVLPVTVLLGGRATARQFGQRIGAGTELTSSFGPSSVHLTGPLSRHEISHDDLQQVRRVDDWVFLRQQGTRMDMLWPAALFPDAELSRIRSAIEDRTSA